ncbi:hypothetical protein B4102_3778 [Heyndrickxia sporothermodurans]|uniref:Uncharacterized protein n=1 Tax=Heyndrickxia sporothermodurans TaxID=46224 RepID=A0A150KLU2_9BACI|nr:hypothetical protein [Heyndrickxia sporothermodurans]KYC92237.1 hypothetical protein B4102_3778 [Heyndrickxia sporothermodurans]
MQIEIEIKKMRVITDSDATSEQLLQALNKTLLAGVEPLEIIQKLYLLGQLQQKSFKSLSEQFEDFM